MYVSNVELESTQLLLNPLYEMRTSSSEVLAMQYNSILQYHHKLNLFLWNSTCRRQSLSKDEEQQSFYYSSEERNFFLRECMAKIQPKFKICLIVFLSNVYRNHCLAS